MVSMAELFFALCVLIPLIAMWAYNTHASIVDDMPLLDLLRGVPEDEEIEKELWED